MRTSYGTWVAAAVLLALLGVSKRSSACVIINTDPTFGPLLKPGSVPRNVAFLALTTDAAPSDDPIQVGELEGGEAILARPLAGAAAPPGKVMLRPDAPLPANTMFMARILGMPSAPFTTSDVIDETPPEVPALGGGEIRSDIEDEGGCGEGMSSCGPFTGLQVSLSRRATDDNTPPDELIYAIYIAESASAAASAAVPIALVYAYEHDGGQSVSSSVDHKWFESDAFAAVSVYDGAGNQSLRSQPVRVNAEASSCGLARRARGNAFSISIVAAAALAGCLRRLGKRVTR